MITNEKVRGKRFAVLGLGRTGMATCDALIASGAEVLAWDESNLALANARKRNLSVVDLFQGHNLEGCNRLIISPGIPHLYPNPHPIVKEAINRGIAVDNDIGLFFEFVEGEHKEQSSPMVIAITGTNGKSTTTALINQILTHAGHKSEVAGNIGCAVLGISPLEELEFIVLEVSSYQLELASKINPQLAIFLNLSPDHLSRHGGLGGYFLAKTRLFQGSKLEKAIIGVDEKEGQFLANTLQTRRPEVSLTRITNGDNFLSTDDSFIADDNILSEVIDISCKERLQKVHSHGLHGRHNLQNAAAALVACRHLGISEQEIISSFKTFKGLPHRSQLITQINGVSYINDSKATNFSSAAKSLRSFSNIHWLAGGLTKEEDFKELRSSLINVKHGYFFGHSAKTFANQLDTIPCSVYPSLGDALNRARSEAESGDTILLAPGGASFDQFRDFEQRGDHFVELIMEKNKMIEK